MKQVVSLKLNVSFFMVALNLVELLHRLLRL